MKSQLNLSSEIPKIYPIANNSQLGNQFNPEEKTALPTTKDISWKNDNFISDEFSQDNKHQHYYSECLKLGSLLIDRPLGMALQPLDMMGPVLMKFNTCEQHWIKPDFE